MFQGWGFLLGEIWALIAAALVLGLSVGWLIWGRSETTVVTDSAEADRLRAELQAEKARCKDCNSKLAAAEARLAASAAAPAAAPMAAAVAAAEPEPAPASADASPDASPDAATEESPGTKPATLDAPRGGAPDDLKLIKGIGPKLEALCNRLGFWHFDQIANWTDAEIAWVDANLETFKGRVTRDNWVAQARVLAAQKS